MKILKKYESFEPEIEWDEEKGNNIFKFYKPIYKRKNIPFYVGDRVVVNSTDGPNNTKLKHEKGTIVRIEKDPFGLIYICIEFDDHINGVNITKYGHNWNFDGINHKMEIELESDIIKKGWKKYFKKKIKRNESFEPEIEWELDDKEEDWILFKHELEMDIFPYRVGDTIEIKFHGPRIGYDGEYTGGIGKIVYINCYDNDIYFISICFNDPSINGHDCDELCDGENGWNIGTYNLPFEIRKIYQ